MPTEERKLAAIVFTDIVGFTELMGQNEKSAMVLLEKQKRLLRPIIENFNGEWLKEIGDGTLSSFPSAVQAVTCALEIQRILDHDPELTVRIGIHIGDIIKKDGDVFGDGVNIASRIQELSDPGGICISKSVNDSIKNQTNIDCVSIGYKDLKGNKDKIELFKIKIKEERPAFQIQEDLRIKKTFNRKWMFSFTFSILISLGLFSGYKWYVSKNNDKISIAILPFGNTIKDEDFDWLSHQFVDELTNKLIKISSLSIKDYSQVLNALKLANKEEASAIDISLAQTLGKKVKSNFILYGNYLIFNKKQIRITSRLLDVNHGTVIISYQRTYELTDLIKVLDTFPDSFKGKIEGVFNKINFKNDNV